MLSDKVIYDIFNIISKKNKLVKKKHRGSKDSKRKERKGEKNISI